MRLTSKSVALLLAVANAAASVTAGKDLNVALDQEESMFKQDKAFKMSPHDKTYGSNRLDDTDKFSVPKQAPNGAAAIENEEYLKDPAVVDNNAPTILNDYDPNRLGISADEAEAEVEAPGGLKPPQQREGRLEGAQKVQAAHAEKDATDGQSGLLTGWGEGSGGVGATATVPAGETPAVSPHGHKHDHGPVAPGFLQLSVISMIVFSELGDKTFFIAALMAMKHPPWFVFLASFSSLALMTYLSTMLGMILPWMVSRRVSTLLASALFLVFGIRNLREGMSMTSTQDAQDEMLEVEVELELNDDNMHDKLEKGEPIPPKSYMGGALEGITNLVGLVVSPLWVQIFTMTFLAEWGDRSQVATVAMGTSEHYIQVIVGGIIGHAICTFIAISGGKLLSTRLSLKTVTLGAALCFFLFAGMYFSEWYYGD